MDEKRKAARYVVRGTAASKNAAKDAIQILSVISDDRPPSFSRLFSPSSSSSSSLLGFQNSEVLHTPRIDDVQSSEVPHIALSKGLPPKPLSVARHALKNVAKSKSASDDVMKFLPEAKATDSFRWLFPRFRSSSSLSSASSSSFHTCIQDEEILDIDDNDDDDDTNDNTERSQISQGSESHSPSSSVITLNEVDNTSSPYNIKKEITEVAREQDGLGGGELEVNEPLAHPRGWSRGWRKGAKKLAKQSTVGNAYAVNDVGIFLDRLSSVLIGEWDRNTTTL